MEKMKSVAIVAAFAFAFSTASAQTPFYLGVKGGISIPNLGSGGGNPVSSGYSSILGPYFGVFAERGITHHFSIQVELNYSAQGGKKNGEQAIPTAPFAAYFPPGTPLPEYFYANYDSKAQLNYLELPILAKYNLPLGGRWKFVADLGPYIGYLLHAKNVTADSSLIYQDQAETTPVLPTKEDFSGNEDITSDIHRFNFGIQGGVGLEFRAGHGYLYLHAGGNYGLLNIQKYAADGKNNTGAATVVVGYALKLR